jgi:hypothetical protein
MLRSRASRYLSAATRLRKLSESPRAIIDQNAGKPCTERESAKNVGVGFNGPYRVEVSSSIKYGFLARPQTGIVEVTDRARQAIRLQKPGDDIEALRQAVLAAPDISEVYSHYRGEYLPDGTFFKHAIVDKFKILADKVPNSRKSFSPHFRARSWSRRRMRSIVSST